MFAPFKGTAERVPARIAQHLTAKARDRCATTSLRSIVVLDGMSKYASARQPSRASYWRTSHALSLAMW